ncbi:hypothetical protein MRB53_005521 [Persea americana]|uniref:Uncharacterized protein n=1 Tax=Persea americana TaxID=3435 RepID=A0ACC2ME58_PERAE|nr:hypothetical protein MRB53_005521 [Persea americana]
MDALTGEIIIACEVVGYRGVEKISTTGGSLKFATGVERSPPSSGDSGAGAGFSGSGLFAGRPNRNPVPSARPNRMELTLSNSSSVRRLPTKSPSPISRTSQHLRFRPLSEIPDLFRSTAPDFQNDPAPRNQSLLFSVICVKCMRISFNVRQGDGGGWVDEEVVVGSANVGLGAGDGGGWVGEEVVVGLANVGEGTVVDGEVDGDESV